VIPAGAWWLHLRLARLETLPDGALALDAGVFGAAALRTFGGFGVIPWSGHLLFLTYSFATTADRRYRALAALLWLVATITKLRYRDDPGAWALGCLLGLALATLATRLHRALVPS
jgi:hypothetical protein